MGQEEVRFFDKTKELKIDNKELILHNDDVNNFDYVIEVLVDICNHTQEQAEQCAFIAHFKGKCDVKKGTYTNLKPIWEEMIHRKLSVTIE
ncbi:MAG: ATP-dependent Clp protease adaptor ClpS [Bacteroidota bacterium]|nr:ATP-dependent Clp protease adaptor ClpS [Bacteroidota bacterium]